MDEFHKEWKFEKEWSFTTKEGGMIQELFKVCFGGLLIFAVLKVLEIFF